MADNKEQKVWVKFCFLLGKSAAETVWMLQEAFKEEALCETQLYEWYSRLKGGEMSCEDQPRPGQPSTCWNDENLENVRNEDQPRPGRPSTCWNDENLENVRNPINADRRRTIDEISEINGLSWSSCQRMLKEDLNMKYVSAKFIPRLLTEDQKNNCLNVCYDFKEEVGNDPQIHSCDWRRDLVLWLWPGNKTSIEPMENSQFSKN